MINYQILLNKEPLGKDNISDFQKHFPLLIPFVVNRNGEGCLETNYGKKLDIALEQSRRHSFTKVPRKNEIWFWT